uniref:ABC-type glutathione-S-conjugate transporter n=3 Tax=Clastoptera arizonana TaxID=38151 RepID=A0A1B6D6I6_9HEMI
MKLFGDLCAFIQPQVLSLLIAYMSSNEYEWQGYLYVALLFIVAEMQTFFNTHYIMTMSEVGLRVRTALISAIYRKAMLMSNSAHKESTVGEIVNLMAVDAQRFIELTAYLNMIWSAPLTMALSFYFLWKDLGLSAAAGLLVMIFLIPFNMFIANRVKLLQMKQMRYKDERVKLMNEILCGMKVLKLYAWEPSFEEQISNIRSKEVKVLKKAALLNASTSFVWISTPLVVSLIIFGVYVLSDERNVIDSQTAFVSISLINIMRLPITQLPMLISVLIQAGVSLRRINKFMETEQLDLNSVSQDETKEHPLIMENATFTWDGVQKGSIILRNINMIVKEGSLVAIVGAVGSGKTSLINAFLGEMDKISGYVNVKGKKSYVPQQAWIQNETLRDNILFGKPMSEKKYKEVLRACALESDLKMLVSGDMTEIGEKGINLSGGQKQRVSLARAVYNNSDVYFLDDPLSAVDSHVGKHIFENVIGPKGLLRKKTRLIVTHAVTYLPEVDYIYVLRGGEIIESGTYKDLLAQKGEFSDFLIQHLTEAEGSDEDNVVEEMLSSNPDLRERYHKTLSSFGGSRLSLSSSASRKNSIAGKQKLSKQISTRQLIQVEKAELGSVKWSVYLAYLKSVGVFLVTLTVVFNIVSNGFLIGSNLWLSKWSSDKTIVVNDVQDIGKRNIYIGVYALFGLGQISSSLLCSFTLAIGTLLAAKWLHFSMLENIFRAPMSFFDTTPIGRIVNRFSKDIDVVDNTLPNNISSFLSCFFQVIGTILVIGYSTPLFLSVIVPVGVLYYLVQRFYVSTSRQLKRMESISRSPIYSHFSESVNGAASIRAYEVQERFIKGSASRVDYNQTFLYPSMVSNRWLGTRLESVGNLVILFSALFSVLDKNLDPGIVGLSVSYALQVTNTLNYCVRMTSEVETNIVAVERIQEYSRVPQEAAWYLKPAPELLWPEEGKITFKDYKVRYREGLDLVLRGISFVVNGGEKVGIVGRTGAGKSSLTLCLFRILEAAGGVIYIDNIDIATLGLNDLRSRITIIPQDPVLFSGTLRINLDPFKKFTDMQIWQALDLAHLGTFAKNLPNGLDYEICEGGENLSVGQKQLVCLARALLRKSKILILDEATAAIDLETDDLIQRTIRKEFKSCTVLTIAHRLNTILDSDRVIVLDKGYLKEFDSPMNLLHEKTSIFYGMARDAGLV